MTGRDCLLNWKKRRKLQNKIEWSRRMTLRKELLDILRCPKCKGPIHLNQDESGLICDECRLMYEIREDIPIMLIEEAKPL